ncbi:hypothetical protein F511_28150 [Dorcoceras hygrometricum]|uniref:Retrotransposon gag domain-containing protein n=1 Tax=Dorcoceras hygrometricum TaxID=472368 RepID=A0A2Z7AS46_9LAMI|nr:hypothetical protein F511_28150 [Dorcoceras hygrometricum]
MLKGDAALWWKGAVVGLFLESLSWCEFKKVYYEKYFPVDARSQLIWEFMSLRQGDKSVAEYVRQFERGCTFVPSIATVESEKLRQFTDGLRPDIRHDVNMADVETYMAAVNRAYRSERGWKDMRDDYQRKRQMQQPIRGQSSQPPAKRPYQGPPKSPSPQGQRQQRQQGQQKPQQQGPVPLDLYSFQYERSAVSSIHDLLC